MDISFYGGLSLILALTVVVSLWIWRHKTAPANGEAVLLHNLIEGLSAQQNQLAGRLASMAEATMTAQAELARTVNERLDLVGKRLGDGLTETSEKTHRTIAELQTRLAVIDQAQKNLTDLSTQMVSLQDILDNKQRRGQFGEQILETLIQDVLPSNIYEFQATLSNRTRVDCLIRLPNPPGAIAIDAKFPLEAYRQLLTASDEMQRNLARRAFQSSFDKHIIDIADKYILPGETAEGALMFLPSEAIYAELHGSFPDLVERARRRRVFAVSPSTLMATLTTVRAILRDARIREQAHEIQHHVQQLTDDVGRLLDRVDNLKKHFSQADKDIREIETSAAKIGRKATLIGELDVAEDVRASIPPPTQ